MSKKLFYFFSVIVFLAACKADKIAIPSYVKVSEYTTIVKSDGSQGTSNQKFTDMALHANGNAYGIFPLGANMPALASGSTSLLIEPVIEVNGVGALRATYELMNACDTLINITEGQITQVIPVFKYYPGVVFRIMDDFNFGSPNIFTQNDSRSSLDPNGFGGGTGNNCLKLSPTSDTILSSVITTNTYYLPPNSVGVYLEYNYLSNVDIGFTLIGVGNSTSIDIGGAHASANWNKSYLYLTPEVSSLNDPVGYQIEIYCNFTDSVGTNAAYIDNIKVISRQ